VSERLADLDPVEIVVVHFDETDRLGEYRSFHHLPDEILLVADPERELYRAFGIGRGSFRRVWGPRTLAAYLRLLGKGHRYRRHRGDSLQLGGDVVVRSDGSVAWTFFPDEPDARPTGDQLATAVEAAGD
jgi:hypothetical protein